MPNYTKLFNTIVSSTIWQEPPSTKIMWITMLALADQNGEVHASIPGLANIAGVSIAEAEAAIERFQSPDTYSRTKDFEGRRAIEIDGGWQLLNHAKYRKMASKEDQKEANAARQKRFREQEALRNTPALSVTLGGDIAEAEADAEADTRKNNTPLTPQGGDLPFGSHEFVEAWNEFCQHRKEKKTKLTPTARKRALKKLEKMGEQEAIKALHHSTGNGYTGVFSPNNKLSHRETKAQREFPSNINPDEVPDL